MSTDAHTRIELLRDDVLSLELLVDLFEDTEDPRLSRYRQKLKKARAALAAAEQVKRAAAERSR